MKRTRKSSRVVHLGRRLLLITSLTLIFAIFYLITWYPIYIQEAEMMPTATFHKYFVNTEGCTIPVMDPFHPSVAHLNKPASPIGCKPKKASLVIQGENRTDPTLVLVKSRSALYGHNVSCFYQAIHRVSEDVSVLNKTVYKIDKEVVPVKDEFVQVKCYEFKVGKDKRQVFDDFFAFIQIKPEVEKRAAERKQQTHQEKLSVLLLAIDSVGKSHFHRMMIKTEKFLRMHIPMVEMFGYNKIGKNTFPVMLPFLTGFAQDEVSHTSDKQLNFLPFVWNDFVASGYRTFFSEDNANTAIFDYVRKGFGAQPTDYYWRPLKIAFQSKKFSTESPYGCIKGRSEAVSILNYTLDFFDKFPNEPVFALTLLSYFTHDYLSTLSRYDEPYMHFLQQMKDKNHLNRTIVFFFSDHGFRFGEVRRTYMGRMEGKLPFLFILIPPWFEVKYPKIVKNLKLNANRLISVLDLHAVLEDLANFTGEAKNSLEARGHNVNLMRAVVSGKRTCREAKIPLQYCACTSRQQIPVTLAQVVNASIALVAKINELTAPLRKQCSVVKLVETRNAASQAVSMDETWNSTKSSIYQVTIQTKPGNGIFEGSIWHLDDGNVYTAEPNIERVNRYGNQSACITDNAIKPFCFCHVTS